MFWQIFGIGFHPEQVLDLLARLFILIHGKIGLGEMDADVLKETTLDRLLAIHGTELRAFTEALMRGDPSSANTEALLDKLYALGDFADVTPALVGMYAPGGIASLIMMNLRVAKFGKLRRLWTSYLALAGTAAVMLTGAAAMIEMVYHLQLNIALGPKVGFMGVTLDAQGVDSWFGAGFLFLTGLAMFELTRRAFQREWDTIQEEIEHEIDPQNLVFEAPQKAQQVWFVKHFGCNVNLGNIAPQEVVSVETIRQGLRADTIGPPSA